MNLKININQLLIILFLNLSISACSNIKMNNSETNLSESSRSMASYEDCINLMKDFLTEDKYAFRSHKTRISKMTGEYLSILDEWKTGSQTAIRLASEVAERQMRELGMRTTSFVIKAADLPPFDRKSELALLNPKMALYIGELNKAGYDLVMDPSMIVSSDSVVLGIFSRPRKSIRILPSSTWDIFIHEYQHFLFEKQNLTFRSAAFQPLENKSKDEAKLILAARKMYESGYEQLAIDETFAVDAEITAAYKMGYVPWHMTIYKKRLYAWNFQLEDIEKGNIKNGALVKKWIQAKKYITPS